MSAQTPRCHVCGGGSFHFEPVLWDALARAWELSPAERRAIDRQQGERCRDCGANLRSSALAAALRRALGSAGWLREAAGAGAAVRADARMLEVNEAGDLSPFLAAFPNHRLVRFPDADLMALPFPDRAFDLVVHSDTLEHVPDPVHALRECRRVLAPGGACCFTVPLVVGRLSRSRAGLPAAHHGEPGTTAPDLRVHTEFGADAWCHAMEAGFDRVELHAVAYPCAVAISAWR